MKTFIKICGTTNLVDALASVEAGADALGFIFAPSKRNIEPEAARKIIAELPQGIEAIGIFVDEPATYVVEVAKQVGLTGAQLHGEESPQYVATLRAAAEQMDVPALKIFKALPATVTRHGLGYFAVGEPMVDVILIDSAVGKTRGGSGQTFDWLSAAPFLMTMQSRIKVMIAGGLTPGNVATAICLLRPWGVDVVTGMESAPGKKDHAKLRAFVSAVRAADRTQAEGALV